MSSISPVLRSPKRSPYAKRKSMAAHRADSLTLTAIRSSSRILAFAIDTSPPFSGGRLVRLWPADARRRCRDGEDLAGACLDDLLDLLAPVPLRGEHVERPAVRPPEHARETGAIELDALEHLAALTDPGAVVLALA